MPEREVERHLAGAAPPHGLSDMRAMRRLRTTEDRVRHWNAVYNGAEESRFSWFEDEPRCSTEMLAALGARPQDPVVDIGTGASRLIDALLDRGFGDVTALDICPAGPRHSANDSVPPRRRSSG